MKPYEKFSDFTRAYKSFQGLRTLPLGIFFLIVGLQALGVTWFGKQGDFSITLPFFLASLISWRLIGRYYDHMFGKVEPIELDLKGELKSYILPAIIFAAIILEIVLGRFGIMVFVAPVALTFGIWWIYFGWTRSRWYYTLAGILLTFFSFTPLLSLLPIGDPVFEPLGIASALSFGTAIIFIALLDHFRLVSTFSQKNGDNHAGIA
jgi:hypothetical protein